MTAPEEPGITSAAEVARFFRRYGWSFDRLDDDTFRTSFRGKTRDGCGRPPDRRTQYLSTTSAFC